jgi:hypothetical protein
MKVKTEAKVEPESNLPLTSACLVSLAGVGFVYTPGMSDRSDSAASFSAEARLAFYEGHRSLALFMILIVFMTPFAGLYVAGLLGVVIGVLVSAAAYMLTPYLWKWIGN